MLSTWHRYELLVRGHADVGGYSIHCPVDGDIFVAVVVVTIVGRRRSRREAVESIEILPLRSIIAKLEQI